MAFAILGVACFMAIWWVTRTSELFCISFRRGRALVVRGRVPPGLVIEFVEVLKRAGVRRATVRAIRTEQGGRIVCSGVDGAATQRLRNVFGLYPAAKLRHAPAIERPTLGQLLGIAWLAWMFDGIRRY